MWAGVGAGVRVGGAVRLVLIPPPFVGQIVQTPDGKTATIEKIWRSRRDKKLRARVRWGRSRNHCATLAIGYFLSCVTNDN